MTLLEEQIYRYYLLVSIAKHMERLIPARTNIFLLHHLTERNLSSINQKLSPALRHRVLISLQLLWRITPGLLLQETPEKKVVTPQPTSAKPAESTQTGGQQTPAEQRKDSVQGASPEQLAAATSQVQPDQSREVAPQAKPQDARLGATFNGSRNRQAYQRAGSKSPTPGLWTDFSCPGQNSGPFSSAWTEPGTAPQ